MRYVLVCLCLRGFDDYVFVHKKLMIMKQFLRILFVPLLRTLLLSGFGVVMVSSILSAAPINVGDEYGGGTVVYILQPGDPGYSAGELHGFVAAKDDLPKESVNWFEAKSAVERMEVNGNKGWSLPNEGELSLLYKNQTLVGGFRDYSYYWSGSEVGQKALAIDFFNGEKILSPKSGTMSGIKRARAIRKF